MNQRRNELIPIAVCIVCIVIAGIYALNLRQSRIDEKTKWLKNHIDNIQRQIDNIVIDGNRISLAVKPLFGTDGHMALDPHVQASLTPYLEASYRRFAFISSYSLFDRYGNAFNITRDESGNFIYDSYMKQESTTVLRSDTELISSGMGYAYVFPVFDGDELIGNVSVQFNAIDFLSDIYSLYLEEDSWISSYFSNEGRLVTTPDSVDCLLLGLDKLTKAFETSENGSLLDVMLENGVRIPVVSYYCKLPFSNHYLAIVMSSDCRAINRSSWLFFFLASLLFIVLAAAWIVVSHYNNKILHTQSAQIDMLESLIQDAPLGLVMLDDKRPIIINDNAFDILSDFIEQPETGPLHEVNLPAKFMDQTENERIGGWSVTAIEKFGTELTLLKNCSDMIIDDHPYKVLIFANISDFEEARVTAIRAERAKSELLSRISRDFRRAIDEIKAAVMLLVQEHPENVALKHISNISRFLSESIADMQDFGDIESGHVIIDDLPFEIEKAVNEVVRAHRAEITRKNLQLSIHIVPGGKTRVVGDVQRFRQVINHLLSNAVKFTPEGSISISIDVIPLDSSKMLIRCTVEDTGIGMTTEQLKTLFSVDVREKEGRSIGLGAIVAKQLVSIMGGTIQASSPSSISHNREKPGSKIFFTIQCHADIEFTKALDFSYITASEQIGVLIVTTADHSVQYQVNVLQRNGIRPDMFIYNNESRDLLANKLIIDSKRYQLIIIEPNDSETAFDIVSELYQKGLTSRFLFALVDSQNNNYLRAKSFKVDYYLNCNDEITKTGFFKHFTKVENLAANRDDGLNTDIRIMLAENNELSQSVAKMVFGGLGYDIRCVTDARELQKAVADNGCDIIFIDSQFPPSNVGNVTKALRASGCNLPIIAMSTSINNTFVRNITAAGANGYVRKPLNRSEVRQTLYKWFM